MNIIIPIPINNYLLKQLERFAKARQAIINKFKMINKRAVAIEQVAIELTDFELAVAKQVRQVLGVDCIRFL